MKTNEHQLPPKKLNPKINFTHPFFDMGKLFILFVFLLLTYQLNAQSSTVEVNGKSLILNNGVLFEIISNDTIQIDINNIIVKFNDNMQPVGNLKLINNIGLALKKDFINNKSIYKIPVTLNFINTVNTILNLNEVQSVEFGHRLKMNRDVTAFRQSATGTLHHNSTIAPDDEGRRWEPNDEHQYDSWELTKTNVFCDGLGQLDVHAWNITVGNPEIIVALIDNGLVWNDLDFAPDNNLGFDFLDWDTDVTPNIPSGFDIEMGTARASIIGARTANLHALCGIAGGYYTDETTPGTTLMMLRAIDDNTTLYSIAAAASIAYAADHGARIINIPFAFPYEIPIIAEAIDYASSKDVLIFAPTGDEGHWYNFVFWPANRPDVIAVGGTNIEDRIAKWGQKIESNTGIQTEISLPAEDIEVRDIYGLDGTTAGSWVISTTELSGAMASGIAALVLSINPCLTPQEVRDILIQSCTKPGGYNYNWDPSNPGHSKELGYGRVDAYQAVLIAGNMLEAGSNITQNTAWNTPKYITSNVTVKAGATLTVTSKIKFAEQVRLYVEKGAHLIIDGGILSSLCSNWDGVVAYGDPTLPQYPESNQAKVTIINKGIIENAMCGIRACIPTDGKAGFENSGGGAIVWAENALFKNCFISASFAPYNYNNSGRFILSSFIVNDQLPSSGFSSFVKLNGIPNIHFKGCEFTNSSSDDNIYQTGNGITGFNSGYTVDGMCRDNADNNCPPEFFVRGKFAGLNYGCYSENLGDSKTIALKNSDYTQTLHGVYTSAVNGLFIKGNTFDVVPTNEMYGVYLNNCNKYLVEGNTFDKTSTSSAKCIGLYINNSGGENNYVYNNIFKNLNHAAIADGINRDYALQTGLCFKCNDFINCNFDLIMPYPVVPPFSVNHGVRAYQGTPGSLNTDAAGNTFSSNAVYNIYNELHPIVYVHHESKYPQNTKIIPAPRTTNTVALFKNNGSTYTKSQSCPPSMLGDTKEAMKAQIETAQSGIQNTETQLAAFTDGGNTEAMSLEVQSAQSTAAFTLYEELIATSPYLSDTVLKSGIENIGALPDAMLRDVLVANPQSAKSGDVMKALDERTIPIADEMKEEVKEGLNNFASYDMMLGNLAMWKDNMSSAQAGLVYLYTADSLYNRSLDSLAAMYTATHTLEAKYNLALLQLNRGNIYEAQQLLVALPVMFNMSNTQLAIHENYVNIATRLALLQQNTNALLAADSSILMQQFSSMATADNTLPDAIARNILHAAGYITYTEPIQLVDPVKSASLNNGAASTANSSAFTDISLEVYPNPASEYCIASYHTPAKGNCMLQISNLQGQCIESVKLKNERNSKVISLKKYTSGTYIVTLLHQNKVVESLQLIVK